MREYNLIVVYNERADHVLMCRRSKAPYCGLLNFVGGKIEQGESGLDAAYRELREETAICREQIALTHVMDLTYFLDGIRLEVYAGRLVGPAAVCGEENELLWIRTDEDFFDQSKFAGIGNIGHILEELHWHPEVLSPAGQEERNGGV